MTAAAIVVEGFTFTTSLIVVEGFGAGTTPPSPPPPPTPEPSKGGGGRLRRREPVRIPQQIVDDTEALYRRIYEGRKLLTPTTAREVADLVGFFAESFDGRLPPAEAVHWRDLVEYPDIDLSVLSRAADELATPPQKPQEPASYKAQWAVEKLKVDVAVAAKMADDEEEEDALMAILMLL